MNVLNEIGSPKVTPKSHKRLLDSSQELSPCASEDFNTPLARRLANKYYQPSSGGTEAPTPARSQQLLMAKTPSRRLSEDMSLTLMEPPVLSLEETLTKNDSANELPFKKKNSLIDDSLLSGIAELEHENEMDKDEGDDLFEEQQPVGKNNKTGGGNGSSMVVVKDEFSPDSNGEEYEPPKVKLRCA